MPLTGGTTIGVIFDRINSVVAAQGFTRAKDAFSFDFEPLQTLDKAFYVEAALEQTDGYCGMAQGELHRIKIWVSRRIKSDPHGAYRALLADLDTLDLPLYLDYPEFGYHVADASMNKEVPAPQPEWSYVVGRMEFLIDIDRALS